MSKTGYFRSWVGMLVASFTLLPDFLLACEACRSVNPNSPLTAGMNAAIIVLLIIINSILGSFVLFFLHLRKRAKLYLNNT